MMDVKDLLAIGLLGGAAFALTARPRVIKNQGSLYAQPQHGAGAAGAGQAKYAAYGAGKPPHSAGENGGHGMGDGVQPAGMFLSTSLLPKETGVSGGDDAFAPLPSNLLSGKAFLSNGVNTLGEVQVSKNSWQGLREEIQVPVAPVSIWGNSSWAPEAVLPTRTFESTYDHPSLLPALK